ncbi:hypothetical protein Hanom_Chr06g00540011 [Helianthus anomalus]
MLVDEPEEDDTEADAKRDQKVAGEEGDDEEKSSSDSEVDETESWENVISDKEKQKKRKRSGDDDDEAYVPSPEHVQEVQTPPSEGRRNLVQENVLYLLQFGR